MWIVFVRDGIFLVKLCLSGLSTFQGEGSGVLWLDVKAYCATIADRSAFAYQFLEIAFGCHILTDIDIHDPLTCRGHAELGLAIP